jgi:2Fe-2S ferredoxin
MVWQNIVEFSLMAQDVIREALVHRQEKKECFMGKIIFAAHDGAAHEADLIAGKSLMQTATDNAIPGIDGDCGGVCACGTCHVIIAAEWLMAVGRRNDDEEQMLQMTPERQQTSRLACQITVTSEMDGMTVQLPEFQM